MISSCTFPAWIRPLNSIPKLRSGELRNSPLLPWVICSKGRSKERNTTEATGLYWHLIRKSGPTVLSRQGCVRMKTWLTDGLGLMRGLILGPSITRPSFLKLIFSATTFLTMWHSPTFKCANTVHGGFIQMLWKTPEDAWQATLQGFAWQSTEWTHMSKSVWSTFIDVWTTDDQVTYHQLSRQHRKYTAKWTCVTVIYWRSATQ